VDGSLFDGKQQFVKIFHAEQGTDPDLRPPLSQTGLLIKKSPARKPGFFSDQTE